MDIRDPIHGNISFSKGELRTISSPAYQRLRAIKQLGFAEFSFPGATHNRFIHSLGVCHIAGQVFDNIFKDYQFSSENKKQVYRQCLRLAALLHDIGHGPLSHTTEEVMPQLSELDIKAYDQLRTDIELGPHSQDKERQANHEDYTIKFLTDSHLTEILVKEFSDMTPLHIACLINKTLSSGDEFFVDQGVDHRTILSQIVSSELDADRMDYLERDAYFCGTNYGRVELSWIIGNLSHYRVKDSLYLALNRRALYSFDDFLLARHHMHLMVYFHHKSIIYEEMLLLYLQSNECSFRLPAQIEDYLNFTDYALFEHLATSNNQWAQRISQQKAYKVLFELHSTEEDRRPQEMCKKLKAQGIHSILAGSMARLSKYYSASPVEKDFPIFVVDQYDRGAEPYPIERSTEIFQKYEEIRRIDRIYVAPEDYEESERIIF